MFLDELIPDLEAHVPDVTDTVYLYGLRYGARKFFRDSQLWCIPLDFSTIKSTSIEFDITVPESTVLHSVPLVLVDGYPIKPVGLSDIRAVQKGKGIPSMWYRKGATLLLAPTPSRDFELEVLGVVVPVREAIEIEADEYIEKYSDAVLFLALSHILSMPNKPWTNTVAARNFKVQYYEELTIAKREALGYLDNRHNVMRSGGDYGKVSDY